MICGQESCQTGFRDVIYRDLTAADCRTCHGPILYERHHVSDNGQAGDCLACHTEAGGYLQTEADCHGYDPSGSMREVHQDHAGDAHMCWVCHGALLPIYAINLVNEVEGRFFLDSSTGNGEIT